MTSAPPPRVATTSRPPPSGVHIERLGLTDVTLIGGGFQVPIQRLEQLAVVIFGPASGWSPLSDEVFFDFGRVPKDGVRKGSLPWSFLALRMLVGHPQHGQRAMVTHAFVDRDTATRVGREVFGFPATPASFEAAGSVLDATADERARAYDEAVVAGGGIIIYADALRYDSSVVAPRPLIKLDLGSGVVQGKAHWIWEQHRGVTEVDAGDKVPFVQLKQLRDAIDPAKACFQELVNGAVTTNHKQSVAARTPKITLYDYRSFGLGSSFGGPLAGDRDFDCRGYSVEKCALDFAIENSGRVEALVSGRDGAPFRFRSGDPQFAPEFEFQNVKLTGFKVPVDRSYLKAIVDKYLNKDFERRDYTYEPTSADIIIECLQYGSMASANPPLGLRAGDSAGQQELLFRVLVGRVDQGSRVMQRPAMFCPFLYVDSAWSFISGREVIGYPKQLAAFSRYEEDGEVAGCRVKAPDKAGNMAQVFTFDCRADRTTESMDTILDREQRAVTSVGLSAKLANAPRADSAWWGLPDLQGYADLDRFVRPWLEGGTTGYGAIQLKRFGEAHMPDSACYNEILEGEYIVRNMQASLPLYRASLHFAPRTGTGASADPFGILEAFGLHPNVMVPAGSWYRATCDFRLRIIDPLD